VRVSLGLGLLWRVAGGAAVVVQRTGQRSAAGDRMS